MLGEVLVLLKDQLNHHLNARSGWTTGESQEDKVVFIDGENTEPILFKLGAVTVLLINLEEENTLRAADLHVGVSSTGAPLRVKPEIRMNLHVLFVARFKQYELGLRYLSDIIQYFQGHPVFDRENTPTLDDRIERLLVELVTLPLSEQNELWNVLRTTYHPSALYKVKMVVFTDQEARTSAQIADKIVRTSS